MRAESHGPYGSDGPPNWYMDLKTGERIKEVTVRHGSIVDAIGFAVTDKNGKTTTNVFGGNGGNCSTIILKEDEYVIQVSGIHGIYEPCNDQVIACLSIHTNFCPTGYGPYGLVRYVSNLCCFSTPVSPNYNAVLEFYGRHSGRYLQSIGVTNKENIPMCEPEASSSSTNWNLILKDGERIKEVVIRHGSIIDGIKFSVIDSEGISTTELFGGNGGKQSKITLEDHEYITQIKGKYGVFEFDNEQVIASLTIHTNVCPHGYGPYGLARHVREISTFSTPELTSFGVISELLGRHNGRYLQSIEVSDQQSILNHGPFGSYNTPNWSMVLENGDCIKEVMIRHGSIIDAIGFLVVDREGKATTKLFGGNGGEYSTIALKDGEYITQISGKYGVFEPFDMDVIATLTIHTSLCPDGYGPYGTARYIRDICTFSTPVLRYAGIYMFRGRHDGRYLQSIGICEQKSILNHGPYGTNSTPNWSMVLENGECIKEVIIRHGSIIDAIGFLVVDREGKASSKLFGGNGGEYSVIALKDDEYITQISGKWGVFEPYHMEVIATLTIHTNLCPDGYGPYGTARYVGNIRTFSMPVQRYDGIFMFRGRHNNRYLQSVGVCEQKGVLKNDGYVSKIHPNSKDMNKSKNRIRKFVLRQGTTDVIEPVVNCTMVLAEIVSEFL